MADRECELNHEALKDEMRLKGRTFGRCPSCEHTLRVEIEKPPKHRTRTEPAYEELNTEVLGTQAASSSPAAENARIEMHHFSSGAKSSVKMPRFDLMPTRGCELLSGRMQYGAGRHGPWNYLKGKDDEEFITDRINHLIRHALEFARYRKTSDLAGVLANAAMLAELDADTVKDGADGSTRPTKVEKGVYDGQQ